MNQELLDAIRYLSVEITRLSNEINELRDVNKDIS